VSRIVNDNDVRFLRCMAYRPTNCGGIRSNCLVNWHSGDVCFNAWL